MSFLSRNAGILLSFSGLYDPDISYGLQRRGCIRQLSPTVTKTPDNLQGGKIVLGGGGGGGRGGGHIVLEVALYNQVEQLCLGFWLGVCGEAKPFFHVSFQK